MDAEDIVRALAAQRVDGEMFCILCGAVRPAHYDDCPYGLAREWVAEHPASTIDPDSIELILDPPPRVGATFTMVADPMLGHGRRELPNIWVVTAVSDDGVAVLHEQT